MGVSQTERRLALDKWASLRAFLPPLSMPYPRLHIAARLSSGGEISLSKEQQHHITRVLRLRSGASLRVFDQQGAEFAAQLQSGNKLLVQEAVAEWRESPLRVRLGQALPRGQRMDYVVQKCTELGVDSITPITSERSYSHREPTASNKLQHYQKIAIHAAEQCWRQQVPTLHPQTPLAAWLQQSQAEVKLIMDENCEQPLESIPSSVVSIDLLVGPEGGFSSQEVRAAQAAGFSRWRLGPRVFRTETAAVSALTILQYLHGDLCRVV